jgi:mannose-6-phosphate isomerase-like protein (cupin superfamily)
MKENRPWGFFENLVEGPGYKVKRIVVKPGKRLSLQYHTKRREHWAIASGIGLLTLNEDLKQVEKGVALEIPLGAKHRVENNGEDDLIIIEVQFGDYLGEDDIVRIEDDFGRVK